MSSAAHRKDVNGILKQCRKAGAAIERLNNGHWKVTNPATGEHCQVAFSPRSGAYTRQLRVKLRRIGIEVDL